MKKSLNITRSLSKLWKSSIKDEGKKVETKRLSCLISCHLLFKFHCSLFVCRIKQAERSEPAAQISEYHLVKSGILDKDVVHVQDLVKSLGRKGYQTEILKKLRKNKVLSKPLEKPVAERVSYFIELFYTIYSYVNKNIS